MLRIEQTYLINAAPEEVWAALTQPALQEQWTDGQPAEYDARVGGTYKLWGDYVTGEVVEYDPPNKLAQTWLPGDWTIQDSVVSFILTQTPKGTQLDLVHENVQPEDYDGTAHGWQEFYIGAIKGMLETGNVKPKPKAKTAKKKPAAKKSVKKAAAKKKVAKKATAAKKKPTPGKRKK